MHQGHDDNATELPRANALGHKREQKTEYKAKVSVFVFFLLVFVSLKQKNPLLQKSCISIDSSHWFHSLLQSTAVAPGRRAQPQHSWRPSLHSAITGLAHSGDSNTHPFPLPTTGIESQGLQGTFGEHQAQHPCYGIFPTTDCPYRLGQGHSSSWG